MRLIVGIDLGTSNCALAYVDPQRGPQAPVEVFHPPQLVRPGEVSTPTLLPSFVYLPSEGELPPSALVLPWSNGLPVRPVVGELARWQGARVPGRLISSAKSWLCHPGVDRQAPILPWGGPAVVEKLSPVQASALYLEHLAAGWAHAHPEAPLSEQEVVITVPASFDEAARALTVSAARLAGLQRFTLLEEPQAALYDFTARHRNDLSKALEGVRLVLVVDVGGGTTDFTLVQVEPMVEGPAMRRIAVGDHLMLGGDNMDGAVAHRVEQRLLQGGNKLPASGWSQLLQNARAAKEALLGANAPARLGVSIAAEGSRLLASTLSAELLREEVEQAVLEGFFPRTAAEELPPRSLRMAIQELGLPYAQDPAITRHLLAFLLAHRQAAQSALGGEASELPPRPDAILLNGGVFNSPQLASALVEAISGWWPNSPRIRLLPHQSLELAVARGAAYYGLTRRGLGRRIGGGAARAYYVGLEGSSAVCLIPRGFEEGQSVELAERSFALTLERPVQLQLYSTTADRIDKPGEVVTLDQQSFHALPPIHTVLKSGNPNQKEVPVHLTAGLTEIGTLELSCLSPQSQQRWRLEFELRGASARSGWAVTESMPARFSEATEWVQRIYGHKPLPVGPKDVKQLSRSLEKTLGPRETWRLPVLRELWSVLFSGAGKRRRSADHERVFFQLLGYALRPGFGYPLDEWRAEQSFGLFKDLVTHHHDKPVWTEFWVMWRRMSGGLSEAAQRVLWEYLEPQLARRVPPDAPQPKGKAKGIQPEGLEEMVRTAASLEHLSPESKVQLGEWVGARLREPRTRGGPWAWSLGRLGSRVPLYGSGHKAVPIEVAQRWIQWLLELDLARVEGAPFAVTQLARMSGDRTRDVEEARRGQVVKALRGVSAPDSWLALVTEPVALSTADEARALGDTLPSGLKLA